jgi:acetyl/propionyl-CoA carboxylase alpha subunit
VILTATVGGKPHRVEVRPAEGGYVAVVEDRSLTVDYADLAGGFVSLLVGGRSFDALLEVRPWGYLVSIRGVRYEVALADAALAAVHHPVGGETRIVAPMPGKIVRILVEEGQSVDVAQGLVVVEAMKMENELKAARGGTVREIRVREGQAVEAGALLLVVE